MTVKLTGGLVIPERVAVTSVVPTAKPVTTGTDELMNIAMLVSEQFHVTLLEISAVEPSEYVPVAVNCCWWLTLIPATGFGVTAIEINDALELCVVALFVPVDVDFDEQAAVDRSKAAVNPMTRVQLINRIIFLFIVNCHPLGPIFFS